MSILREVRSRKSTALTRALTAAQPDDDPVLAAFMVSQVHIACDETGDALETHRDGEGRRWVHAYSSADLVPGVADGQEVDMVAMRGADLLNRLPAGAGVRLDPGSVRNYDLVDALPLDQDNAGPAEPNSDPTRDRDAGSRDD